MTVEERKRPPRSPAAGVIVRLSRTSGRLQRLLEVLGDLVDEALGGQPALLVADEEGQVLGHRAALDGVDADLLQRLGELGQRLVAVELGAVFETAGPGE